MTKYFEIDEETFNSLSDDIKQNLKTYEPEDTSGLVNKANELLSETKKKSARIAELEAEVARHIADSKKRKVEPAVDDSKLEDALAKLEAAQKESDTLKAQMRDSKINSEALKIAASLTKDTRKADLIAKEVRNRLHLENDDIVVLSKDGKPTISKLDDLTAEVKQDYDFLIDGNPASGGGALGSKGRASDSAKTITYSEAKKLSPRERGSLVKKGIEIIED